MRCQCFIIPSKVLNRFARDKTLTASERKSFADAALFENQWRTGRTAHGKVAVAALAILARGALQVGPPAITAYDCQHGTTLPGKPLPANTTDSTARRALTETRAVADFFQTVFGRNSVDNAGKTLMSSIHFSVDYNNAFWNGTQMTYGDGDGNIFVDFTKSNDVIAHELTHGVTEFSAQLAYTNEAGGLNESMSDVFASMFRQWRGKQNVHQADWLIGKDIMGPGARSRGYTCLRDMVNPAGKHCLSRQPTHYSQYRSGMDPHESSGIANLAFSKAAKALGGQSWEKAGKIWYAALTESPVQPNIKMRTFANRTRRLAATMFPGDRSLFSVIDNAWLEVGR
jgi:Zn-dependent metalloprotease